MLISNVSDGDKMATAGIERRKEHYHASNLLVPNWLFCNISDEYRMATADTERDDRLGKGQFQ